MKPDVLELKKSLKKGIVTFQYKKKDGTIRTAKGTTNVSIIEDNYIYKGGEGPSRYGYTSYWDVDKNDWRCFNEKSFIGIISSEF